MVRYSRHGQQGGRPTMVGPQARTMRVLLLAAAAASALELSGDTFEAEVFGSGKNSFIKFLAPW